MSTIQSPSHALGLMAINQFNQIAAYLPNCINSPDGPGQIYPLILGMDAMLYSYRDKMHFAVYDEQGNVTRIPYWQKIQELKKRREDLQFGTSAYGDKWIDWFHDYLVLLSSTFNQIGLAPLKISDNVDWDEQPYIPPEHTEDSEPGDQAFSDQNI